MTLHENQPTLIVNFQSYHALDFSVHRGKKKGNFCKAGCVTVLFEKG